MSLFELISLLSGNSYQTSRLPMYYRDLAGAVVEPWSRQVSARSTPQTESCVHGVHSPWSRLRVVQSGVWRVFRGSDVFAEKIGAGGRRETAACAPAGPRLSQWDTQTRLWGGGGHGVHQAVLAGIWSRQPSARFSALGTREQRSECLGPVSARENSLEGRHRTLFCSFEQLI